MKLITLNIWGGKLYDSLLHFVKEYSQKIDVFCFQEVYQAPIDKLINRDMHADIYGKLASSLPHHTGYFAPHLQSYDLGEKAGFDLKAGLAIYIRNNIEIKGCKDIFIYRNCLKLLNNNITTIPRNLQYISLTANDKDYLIGHFHGIWYPKTKVDTEDRIKQTTKIRDFYSNRTEGRKILCGDFNLLPSTKSIEILEKGMINLIKKYNIKTTRNIYYKREEKHADYVLASPNVIVKQFTTIDKLVSDHLPLLLEFA